MNAGRVCVVDLETTGLYPEAGHEPFEWGMIVRDRDDAGAAATVEYLWRTCPDLTRADPEALRLNRFHERTADMPGWVPQGFASNLAHPDMVAEGRLSWSDPALVAEEFAELTAGAVVVGANPGFDVERFLRPYLARRGLVYSAHYRPLCVTTMGYGWLCARGEAGGLSWPLVSDEVSRAVGVDPDRFDRHGALGDCRWAAAQLDVITGGGL